VDVNLEIEETGIRFGPDSRNRLAETADASATGAEAALESFYYAFHHGDARALRAVWSASPLAQLDNPVGGIVRGADAIAGLYQKALASPANIRVTFGEVVAYHGQSHVVFAGRETGSYTATDGTAVPLEIRTSRYFRYSDGRWHQYHHHGSIDDPDALRAFQRAIRGAGS
jgi:ketosteroid isomerase-like protein